jgi:hypothetical protein
MIKPEFSPSSARVIEILLKPFFMPIPLYKESKIKLFTSNSKMSSTGPAFKKRNQTLRITIDSSTQRPLQLVSFDSLIFENMSYVFVSPVALSPNSFSKLQSPSKWMHAFTSSHTLKDFKNGCGLLSPVPEHSF